MTPQQIQDKFSLPNVPKFICDVDLPSGTRLREGFANEVPGWGTGGGIQYDLMGKTVGKFSNQRLLK